ncbi:MAG: two-component system, OmpR family, sensor histidine kinase VanS [Solirubrobacteraceae bacterium]|nr:two-component system, OmpR family, sensor histidine kinase VanS [Solirubrobacteraceae bacterium]
MPRLSLARLTPRRMLRLPSRTVRLRLTLLYSGLFFVSGALLLGITYLLVRRSTGPDLIVAGGSPPGPSGPRALKEALANPDVSRYVRDVAERQYARALSLHANDLHQLLVRSGIALAIMTAVSIALGWLVAGRVLRPLRAMTATTRQNSERNLHERLALAGPRDELKDLADTVDGLLARLEAHVAEQQRFAANASHELRTPLAVTQTLLDVARSDPKHDDGELVERLRAVNTRAIDLTEALLLLTRADQRSFTREDVDLSLMAEEATETLLPLAEERGVTIETSVEMTPTIGSRALLLQLSTNLIHNAIVHNLPQQGTVWVTTSTRPDGVELTVENTGTTLTRQTASTLSEPFLRSNERTRNDHAGVGLGLAIVKSIAQAHDGTLTLTPRDAGGLCVTVELPAASPPR